MTQNYLPASNFGAITKRLDDLIRHHIDINENLDRTTRGKRIFEKMLRSKALKSCIDPNKSVSILVTRSIGE